MDGKFVLHQFLSVLFVWLKNSVRRRVFEKEKILLKICWRFRERFIFFDSFLIIAKAK